VLKKKMLKKLKKTPTTGQQKGDYLLTVGGSRSNFSLSLHASASQRPLQLTTITQLFTTQLLLGYDDD